MFYWFEKLVEASEGDSDILLTLQNQKTFTVEDAFISAKDLEAALKSLSTVSATFLHTTPEKNITLTGDLFYYGKNEDWLIRDAHVLHWILESIRGEESSLIVCRNIHQARDAMRQEFADAVDYSVDAIAEYLDKYSGDPYKDCNVENFFAFANNAETWFGDCSWVIHPLYYDRAYHACVKEKKDV